MSRLGADRGGAQRGALSGFFVGFEPGLAVDLEVALEAGLGDGAAAFLVFTGFFAAGLVVGACDLAAAPAGLLVGLGICTMAGGCSSGSVSCVAACVRGEALGLPGSGTNSMRISRGCEARGALAA